MKTFRMFGMALVAIVSGISLASCSKDNNPDAGEILNEKKLVKFEVYYDPDSKNIYSFKYDDKGKVVEIISDHAYRTDTYKYTWGDNAIMVIYDCEDNYGSSSGTENYIYTLDKGLIREENYNDGNIIYTYDSSNKLAGRGYFSFIWKGDELVSILDNDYQYENVITFSYMTSYTKGYNPMILDYISRDPLIIAHPELARIRNAKLPVSASWIYTGIASGKRNTTSTYSYEYDKEGYVTKIIETEKNEQTGKIVTYTSTLMWE